jgi:phosphomannomutase/phosphoglucomutase
VTIFRAYDIRGIYGTELTEENIKRIGQAFGSIFNKQTIAIGRDTRTSGPSLERSFLEGVLSTGCDTEIYGVIPISILGFTTSVGKLDAAAYISASHNPPEYNGVRFRKREGYGMLYRETDFGTYYDQENFKVGSGEIKECSSEEAVSCYANYVGKKVNFEKSLKIVLDMGNGSACIMRSLYQKMGYNPVVINGSEDGKFPGRGPAPTEESMQKAAECVVSRQADYGIGFDADADRGLIIDDKGRIVPPEKIAIILAKQRCHPGDLVIASFDCSMILERELEPEGIRVERERVGDVFIANKVKNSGAVIGVERSAHFFMPVFQYSDDPFAMSLALGEIISQGEKLSKLADQIPDYPYLQESIRIENDYARIMSRLEEKLAQLEPDTTDGLRITTDGHSILIRPSNTEPLLRLTIEIIDDTTGDDLNKLRDKYEQIIREAMK